jgi:RNA polymerase sigma-70 factor (ECF subfamily)
MDEVELIQAARKGDLNAFNRLILAYQDMVYSQAYRVLGDPQAADDAAQVAFISAYKNLRKFRG